MVKSFRLLTKQSTLLTTRLDVFGRVGAPYAVQRIFPPFLGGEIRPTRVVFVVEARVRVCVGLVAIAVDEMTRRSSRVITIALLDDEIEVVDAIRTLWACALSDPRVRRAHTVW